MALLHRVHAALIRMARSGPEAASWDVVVDSCRVRAKRGGELTGPNPPTAARPGTNTCRGLDRRHPAGGPAFCRQRPRHAALPALLRLALVVCAAIGRLAPMRPTPARRTAGCRPGASCP